MARYRYLARTTLFLMLVALAAAAGCQRPTEPDQKKQSAAETKQVTVDLTGMT